MADRRGGRQRFNPKAGFRQSAKDESSSGVHAAIIKQARQSGQLNLSGRGLATGENIVMNSIIQLFIVIEVNK